MIILFITPLRGAIRNYSKYRYFNLTLFLRTPIVYIFLHFIFRMSNPWKILIFERWFFFVYKTILSIYRRDYFTKKEKYMRKYNLKYSEKEKD